jgi:hypothetical protein
VPSVEKKLKYGTIKMEENVKRKGKIKQIMACEWLEL